MLILLIILLRLKCVGEDPIGLRKIQNKITLRRSRSAPLDLILQEIERVRSALRDINGRLI